MPRRPVLFSVLILAAVLVFTLAVSQASARSVAPVPLGGPVQTANALATTIKATAAAALTQAGPTVVAGATRLSGTITGLAPTLQAGATKLGPTAAAMGTNAARTVTALAPTLQAGATKLGPTAAAVGTNAARTATALAPTLQAGATKLGPTAAAVGPNAARTATALAPTLQAGATKVSGTATSVKATATALRGTLTPPATVAAADASLAITTYASQVLGLQVTVVKAAGWTGTINKSLTQTSAGSAAQAATLKIAGKTYEALLSNGAASLSYGSGTISGDVTVDVQASSLGVYALVVTSPTTVKNAAAALALAQVTFPGLQELAYQPYAAATPGYAWYFKGTANGYDPKTKKATTLAEAVILYVVPGATGKTATVSVTVGRGDFAAQIKLP